MNEKRKGFETGRKRSRNFVEMWMEVEGNGEEICLVTCGRGQIEVIISRTWIGLELELKNSIDELVLIFIPLIFHLFTL